LYALLLATRAPLWFDQSKYPQPSQAI
jgi:hypothetical protein